MKMETTLYAERAGRVAEVLVKPGTQVEAGDCWCGSRGEVARSTPGRSRECGEPLPEPPFEILGPLLQGVGVVEKAHEWIDDGQHDRPQPEPRVGLRGGPPIR